MSRLAKKPIAIPEKTEVKLDGTTVRVRGPLGELSRMMHPVVGVTVSDTEVNLVLPKMNKHTRALPGTVAAHIRNMIEGVTKGFEKKLIVEGVGFKVEAKGETLALALGFSHPVNVPVPKGIKATAEKGVITISGINKDEVGQFAATVRKLKEPEPYKGKGIRYADEVIRRKQGKKSS